jgi:hypothetical protein
VPKLSELPDLSDIKILYYGNSGSGKTVGALSYPTPMYVADFDGKVNSAARIMKEEQKKLIDYDDYRKASGDAFVLFESFVAKQHQLVKDKMFTYKTIVVDSLTICADLMLKALMARYPSARVKPNIPSQQDYGVFTIEFKTFIMRLLELPCNIVVTGHIQESKDEMTGEMLRMILLPGARLPKWLPVVFEEVHRTFTENRDGKTVYLAQTKSDVKFACRSQIPGLAAVIPLGYNALTESQK